MRSYLWLRPWQGARRRSAIWAGAAALLATAGCSSGTHIHLSESPPSRTSATRAVHVPCQMPSAPSPGPGSHPPELPGPASSALTGGAAKAPVTLDHGSFDLVPPPPGSKPRLSTAAFLCEAMASDQVNGATFGDGRQSGMAVGYGLVTISPGVQVDNQTFNQSGSPKAPAPPRYDRRLAWVAVVVHETASSCPSMSVRPGSQPSPPTTTTARPSSWDYSVFVADASSGDDAVVYTEAAPAPCGGSRINGPYRSIPIEAISVPWKLVSRNPDGYSARIEAQVPQCWTVPSTVDVERGSNLVQVPASAVAGQTCGPPRPLGVTLDADTVFDDLPAELVPAPLGPITSSVASQVVPAPTQPGHLVQLAPQRDGTTLRVRVDDVLVAAPPLVPLPGATTNSVTLRSSDPTVVSLLSQSAMSLPELRAWKAGTAVISDSTGWSITVDVSN